MPHYCVQSRASTGPLQTYWGLAEAPGEAARALVALNVPGASHARDERAFDCIANVTKTPPPGVIYRDIGGPITITVLG
jgi:hypothetical protein